MRYLLANILSMALTFALGAGIATAQNSSVPLGDFARKVKAQREKSGERAKVYTNEDLEALPPPGQHLAGSPAKPSPSSKEAPPGEKRSKEAVESEAGKESAATGSEATPSEETHGEKYFRGRMSKLQDRLDIDQRELGVLEQKLGQSQMMYYPNPNQGLLQESGPAAMSDVYGLQDQITKKKEEIAADHAAIEDLREQLRREGGEPGWLR